MSTERNDVNEAESNLVGFSVAPRTNCPHVSSDAFRIDNRLCLTINTGPDGKAPRKNIFNENVSCATCGDAQETWVCLTCSRSGCSRYKAAHMVDHSTDTSHDHANSVIAMSLADLSTWCFACDDYITHPKLEPVFQELYRGKFGVSPSGELHEAKDQ